MLKESYSFEEKGSKIPNYWHHLWMVPEVVVATIKRLSRRQSLIEFLLCSLIRWLGNLIFKWVKKQPFNWTFVTKNMFLLTTRSIDTNLRSADNTIHLISNEEGWKIVLMWPNPKRPLITTLPQKKPSELASEGVRLSQFLWVSPSYLFLPPPHSSFVIFL